MAGGEASDARALEPRGRSSAPAKPRERPNDGAGLIGRVTFQLASGGGRARKPRDEPLLPWNRPRPRSATTLCSCFSLSFSSSSFYGFSSSSPFPFSCFLHHHHHPIPSFILLLPPPPFILLHPAPPIPSFICFLPSFLLSFSFSSSTLFPAGNDLEGATIPSSLPDRRRRRRRRPPPPRCVRRPSFSKPPRKTHTHTPAPEMLSDPAPRSVPARRPLHRRDLAVAPAAPGQRTAKKPRKREEAGGAAGGGRTPPGRRGREGEQEGEGEKGKGRKWWRKRGRGRRERKREGRQGE